MRLSCAPISLKLASNYQRPQLVVVRLRPLPLGKTADLFHFYRACLLKGIEPKVREELPPDPFAFVATVNLHRRHLSDEQRGIIAAQLATMRQGARTDLSPIGERSQARAAELLKVSKRRVERSHEVIEKGVPDLVDAVKGGEVKVSAAAEFAKAPPPLDQARLIVEHGSPAAALKAMVKAAADRAEKAMPRKVPDPRAAADRAEERAGLDAARAAYVASVEAANLTVPQRTSEIKMVIRLLYTDGLPDIRLLLGSSDRGALN